MKKLPCFGGNDKSHLKIDHICSQNGESGVVTEKLPCYYSLLSEGFPNPWIVEYSKKFFTPFKTDIISIC